MRQDNLVRRRSSGRERDEGGDEERGIMDSRKKLTIRASEQQHVQLSILES
jgi:hypothetical protein